MKKYSLGLLASVMFAAPAYSQTTIHLEDFEGGAADVADVNYVAVSQVASGGQDGGAYVTTSYNIDTAGGGGNNTGGYTVFRCPSNPSQAPALDCSSGNFVGDYYFGIGVQEISFWMRHNSAKAGGLEPIIRVASPNNAVGASAVWPAIPANTWTQLTVPLDPQDPLWDKQWGQLIPDAVNTFDNVARLQFGFFIDPNDPDYTENGVTFDLDDVELAGGTMITAVVDLNTSARPLHPHHNGGPNAVAGLNDAVIVEIYGASTGAGDPVDLDTADIDTSSVRLGQIGGAAAVTTGLNLDGDGINDAGAISNVGSAVGTFADKGDNCSSFGYPDDMPMRGELTTGEVISGIDGTIATNCNAQCH
jgi:hypothetical protein